MSRLLIQGRRCSHPSLRGLVTKKPAHPRLSELHHLQRHPWEAISSSLRLWIYHLHPSGSPKHRQRKCLDGQHEKRRSQEAIVGSRTCSRRERRKARRRISHRVRKVQLRLHLRELRVGCQRHREVLHRSRSHRQSQSRRSKEMMQAGYDTRVMYLGRSASKRPLSVLQYVNVQPSRTWRMVFTL